MIGHMLKRSSTVIVLATFAAIPMTGGMARAQTAPAQPAPAAPAAPAAGVPQPSDEAAAIINEIQANMDLKQFPAAVKAASRVLALHGPAAAEGIDRFEITMEKGYAQAGMRSISAAILTFKAAAKETKDPRQTALSKWTADLFHTANASTYNAKSLAPNGQKRGPFNLLDADQRKDAFGAFLDDNLAVLEPKVKAATLSQKLPEIFPILQQVIDLDQLDLIANGNDDKTAALATGLLDHSKNLLNNALKADWARVGDIDTHANIVTTVPSQVVINNSLMTQTTSKKNGLSDSNKAELNNIISVCQKIHDAAEAFLPLARSDKDWTTLISDSDRVASRASDVLTADYGTATSTGSTVTDNGTNGGIGVGIDNNPLGGNPLFPSGTTPTTPQQPARPATGTPSKPDAPTAPALKPAPTKTPVRPPAGRLPG